MSLNVVRWGSAGEKLVCVHGSISAGEAAFAEQRVLAEHWQVIVPSRRGSGDNPPVQQVDVAVDAEDVIELVGEGAHLLGTSMGGVVAMIAAGRIPERIYSLTLIEPPAFPLAADLAPVREVADALRAYYSDPPRDGVEAFCTGFLAALGLSMALPTPYPPALERAVRNLMTERPWRLDVPIGALVDGPYPKLVVSGGWSPAFEGIADRLAALLGAEREVFTGASHAVQRGAPGFNTRLANFLERARGRAAQA